jgi:hypothetical protein
MRAAADMPSHCADGSASGPCCVLQVMQILQEQASLEQDAPAAPAPARNGTPDVQTAEFQLDSSSDDESSPAYEPSLAQRGSGRASAAPAPAEQPVPVITTRLSYNAKQAEQAAAAPAPTPAAAAPRPAPAPQVDLLGMDGPAAAAAAAAPAVADVADMHDFFAGGAAPAAAASKPAAVQSPDDLDSFFSGGSSSGASSRPAAAAAAARPAAASSSKSSAASGLSLDQLARQQVVLPGNVNVAGFAHLYDDKDYQSGGADEPEVRRLLREKRLAERNAKMMGALQVGAVCLVCAGVLRRWLDGQRRRQLAAKPRGLVITAWPDGFMVPPLLPSAHVCRAKLCATCVGHAKECMVEQPL